MIRGPELQVLCAAGAVLAVLASLLVGTVQAKPASVRHWAHRGQDLHGHEVHWNHLKTVCQLHDIDKVHEDQLQCLCERRWTNMTLAFQRIQDPVQNWTQGVRWYRTLFVDYSVSGSVVDSAPDSPEGSRYFCPSRQRRLGIRGYRADGTPLPLLFHIQTTCLEGRRADPCDLAVRYRPRCGAPSDCQGKPWRTPTYSCRNQEGVIDRTREVFVCGSTACHAERCGLAWD